MEKKKFDIYIERNLATFLITCLKTLIKALIFFSGEI